ncbi:MAG: hypothetical protein A3H45_02670 [Ignavibacteria bacterium RIFCSPLOWO2_02_FULL_55_14]|nr:MAG: hypothetical protein A3H45_02670 [Ignavibacteria bacterium RIFCSPLOWO2_02_FULL_55_14]
MSDLLKALERVWRHGVVYPVFRALFRNMPVQLPIDIHKVKKLLILRYDRLGDMVVTSWVCRTLHELCPDLHVAIVASPLNAPIARLLNDVDEIFIIGGPVLRSLNEIRRARAGKYDVVLNFIFNRTTSGGVLANLMAPLAVKVGQGDSKYAFYFNALLSLRRGDVHMAEILNQFCADVFGRTWSVRNMRLELRDDKDAVRRVESFLDADAGRAVIVNLSAGHPDRYPSAIQVDAVVDSATRRGHPVVFIAGPGNELLVQRSVERVNSSAVRRYPFNGTAPFEDIIALVRRAAAVVTPDTSLVHVASAVGCPLVAVFTSAVAYNEWLPWKVRNEVIIGEPGQSMSAIGADRIVAALERILVERKLEKSSV